MPPGKEEHAGSSWQGQRDHAGRADPEPGSHTGRARDEGRLGEPQAHTRDLPRREGFHKEAELLVYSVSNGLWAQRPGHESDSGRCHEMSHSFTRGSYAAPWI